VINVKYNAYDELMSYFQFEFNIYIVLFVIVLVGVIKAIVGYRQLWKLDDTKNLIINKKIYDLTISLLAILGLTNGMFFQGVISDIPLESGYVWLDKSMYLFIASIVLFNVQIIFMVLTDMRTRKLRKSCSDC